MLSKTNNFVDIIQLQGNCWTHRSQTLTRYGMYSC